jgi:protein-S-isoprenylcysteine O-methyltransferase Ste14
MSLEAIFQNPIVRFGTSGTLITLYSVADHMARRAGRDPLRAGVKQPRWLGVLIIVCVLAFYGTIRPWGGPVLGGAGNIAGIALALVAMTLRWRNRMGATSVRQPEVATRMLFYVALPFAAGVPSGLLTLTLPAVIVSAWWCMREDRVLTQELGEVWRSRMAHTKRWVPGVW